MIRFGLCCIFRDEPIKFRTTTATAVQKLDRQSALNKVSDLCFENAKSLLLALEFCDKNSIGCFRVTSNLLPLKTHPTLGYNLEDLPQHEDIFYKLLECNDFAKNHNIRLSFHPDQFVVLNSKKPEVVNQSLIEIEYHAEVAEIIGADVINIHGGGAFGNKPEALSDFCRSFDRLSDRSKTRLTLENDDKVYTPEDLLPICQKLQIPLVYDVHHHRCCKDTLSVEQATNEALKTWNREPLFHLSSPIEGWNGNKPERHHDFIDVNDFPENWKSLDITVEIEAKAKEAAISLLKEQINLT